MKVLILSCSTGGGHNSAARAVAEEVEAHGGEAIVLDHLSLAGNRISSLAANIYVEMVKRVPGFFGLLYKIGLFVSTHVSKSPIYYANGCVAKPLQRYLEENPVDIIAMPHLFPAETLAYMKHHGVELPPTIAIMTDYTCIPFWEETACDYYIVPDKQLESSIIKRGIPKEKLRSFGIPVSGRFQSDITRQEARARLSLPPEDKYILVIGGSMGAGNLLSFTRSLAKACRDEKIIVICGSNKRSQKKMKKAFAKNPHVIPVGYTLHMFLYLKACDLVFTKPGGLSSTEAVVSGIPLVHTDPIPGCESKNRSFFSSKGMSISPASSRMQIQQGLELLHQSQQLADMLRCQKEYSHPEAAAQLYAFMQQLC